MAQYRFEGRTAIVTGAGGNPSLGRAHALLLGRLGANVVVNDIGAGAETPNYPDAANAETVAGFVAAAESAPDELSTIANVMPCPPLPFVPEEHHGKLVIFGLITYGGDPAAGAQVVAPLRALAEPLADFLVAQPYGAMYPPEDPDYHPTAVSRTMFVDRIDGDVAAQIMDWLEKSDASMRVAQLRVLGGAMARVPDDATAFAHRTSRIMVNVAAFYEGPEDKAGRQAWVDEFSADLEQQDTGAYAEFFHSMLSQGVYLPPSAFESWFVSGAHDDAAVDRVLAAIPAAASAAAEAFATIDS
jgi:NAD(P)-dependent dehydrogenase (short-subunit alcohol dehydrogenase family)